MCIPCNSAPSPSVPAPIADPYFVVVTNGQSRGERAKLVDRLRIGHARDNDLVIADPSVGDYQCELERHLDRILVRDLGGGTPTRVGCDRVHETPVSPGAVLRLGAVELTLERSGCEDTPENEHRLDLRAFDPTRSYRQTRAIFDAQFERSYVSWLLERHKGNISAAAREARMDRKHLYDLARKHGLRGRGSSIPAK